MNEALQFVDSLAVRLKAPATALWAAYVNQARIEGITYIIQALLILIFTIIWTTNWSPKLIATYYKTKGTNLSGGEGYLVAAFSGWLAVTGLVAMAFSHIGDIGGLLNPNYWAVQRLLGR